MSQTITPEKKAKSLYKRHGYEAAVKTVDPMLDQQQEEFNQDEIDFWLDVKLELKAISDTLKSI